MSCDKSETTHIKHSSTNSPSSDTEHFRQDWTAEEEYAVKYATLSSARILHTDLVRRKADLRIFPMFCIISGLSLLDRTNISGAYITGLERDLKLNVGARYNLALLIFSAFNVQYYAAYSTTRRVN
ncbi:hypothetical protein BU23DRAFT_633877 [Bimuria novae-zelandiae CBS 107.79]|uniref:Major facilitator superfamily (MFS) profile domain-containing protein n=1 Tax=Bimuria novae-zelandiae CBS 107.79 TaxID=1447943 RepID=A0A6A5UIF8_9PLEO|nr:hypothetical protein BU23DRAFT_633877 [Bimuria novae-zelandiae CBS 107.79]